MSTAPDATSVDLATAVSPIVPDKVYTAEEFLEIPDAKSFELVGGKLVGRNMGAESSRIGHIITSRLEIHAADHELGMVWGADCSYQVFGDDSEEVLRPDGSFIAKGRLPDNLPPKGHLRIAPDLAVEVVSPNDLAEYIEGKIEEYLQAGVRLIWIVYPESRHILVHRSGSTVERLGIEDELTGEEVLPGFKLAISKIFPVASSEATESG